MASDAYRQAGVDIDAGGRAVDLMRRAVKSTHGPRVLADVGHFGGLFALDGKVLVASADGVGTKLKLAFALGTHRSIGHDIVNHCVNDILTCGARPLFFLDYIASGKIVPEQIAEIVGGMAEACREAECALLGGETAEMPGMYHDGEYDVAGFIVGSVQRDRLVLGEDIAAGDVVLALPSNGLHTNGYSLARKVFALEGDLQEVRARLEHYEKSLDRTLGEALTEPHRSYLREIGPLLDLPDGPIKGMAHITGGGLIENIPRILTEGCAVELYTDAWEVPPLFKLIEEKGGIDPAEMARVFNMGLGMVIIVGTAQSQIVQSMIPAAVKVGRVVAQDGGDRVVLRSKHDSEHGRMKDSSRPLRLGVLASGRGTNLQAILDAIASGKLDAEVSLVVCNHAEAAALGRAKEANAPTALCERKDYPSRLAQERSIVEKLVEARAELVVCAGWDRIFRPEVVQQLAGRIINVHPSLLPAFGGSLHAIEEALEYGVKVTGCTVHFVTEQLDAGPIISQAPVPILLGDTAESLGQRIHAEEHRLLVEAINLYSEGRLKVNGRKVERQRLEE